MTDKTDRLWQGVHDDAPRDDEGRPVHPERGYIICGQPKTDATANNGRKREDVPYCLQYAGAGTDRPTEAGGACSKHGGAGGAPTGWENGNARHLLFSERMNEDDRDVFEKVVEGPDGELIGIDEMAEMLTTSIGWEYTRLVRAVDKIPDAELVEQFECPECGKSSDEEIREPHEYSVGAMGDVRTCDYIGPAERKKAFVTFGDKSFERKESHLANLMTVYKQLTEGTDVNVRGDHDVSVEGGGSPVEVSITSVGVDLPAEDVGGDEDDDGGDE